jgi:hypothetical protein
VTTVHSFLSWSTATENVCVLGLEDAFEAALLSAQALALAP